MPKKVFEYIVIPKNQPDRCRDCPLLGLIPADEREKGSKQTHICMAFIHQGGIMAGRFTLSRKSEHDQRHPLHRLCDKKWEIWHDPRRGYSQGKVGIPVEAIVKYRLPFEESLQLSFFRNI